MIQTASTATHLLSLLQLAGQLCNPGSLQLYRRLRHHRIQRCSKGVVSRTASSTLLAPQGLNLQ